MTSWSKNQFSLATLENSQNGWVLTVSTCGIKEESRRSRTVSNNFLLRRNDFQTFAGSDCRHVKIHRLDTHQSPSHNQWKMSLWHVTACFCHKSCCLHAICQFSGEFIFQQDTTQTRTRYGPYGSFPSLIFSQGSVATCLQCRKIVSYRFTAGFCLTHDVL